MKLSYAVTVKDEFVEIQNLLQKLITLKQPQDEIVVLWDSKNGDKEVETYLRKMNSEKSYFNWYPYEFDGHFANLKNELTKQCSGDYIFQIDADEYPHETLMDNLHSILEANDVDVILVPRVNTVEGLTPQHIQKWGWNVNEHGWVNFPDPQWRIYKNSENIRWENKVHEKLVGYDTISNLPWAEELSLYHPKQIERQEKQNEYYETLV
ncbi:glycosyltransferase [bacterium]|nr:glycosyltransferase [bacterium]